MYMIRPTKELKQQVKLTGSPQKGNIKNLVSDLPDNQDVLIVVN